jgi:hypothetical protein
MHTHLLRRAAGCALIAVLLAACGDSKSPVTPGPLPACSYTVSPGSAQAPAAGQTFSVHVETAAGCAWTARALVSWVTLSVTSGFGPADIGITVLTNEATAERSGTVTIAEREVSVRQSGRSSAPCVYSLDSPSSTFGADGGPGRLTVSTAAGCAWNATVNVAWLTLRTAAGSGPGEILYDVARYDGTTTREGRIAIDGASFVVRQDPPAPGPCAYAVDPTSVSLHWHGAAGEGLEVRVTTSAHCGWTAASNTAWIELVTAAASTGSGVARVRIGAYTLEPTRSGPLMIRWPSETAGQNVWITQEGCRYAISLTADSVPAAGGRRRVSVFGTPVSTTCMIGCPWEAASSVPWIRFAGATSRAGDDDIFYDVDPNTTGVARAGTLTIAGKTLVVSQGG